MQQKTCFVLNLVRVLSSLFWFVASDAVDVVGVVGVAAPFLCLSGVWRMTSSSFARKQRHTESTCSTVGTTQTKQGRKAIARKVMNPRRLDALDIPITKRSVTG